MRITTGGMMRNFNTNLSRTMQQMNGAFMQAYTEKKFQRGSEDVASATKTKQLYREYQQNEIYLSNIGTAYSRIDTAESILVTCRAKSATTIPF